MILKNGLAMIIEKAKKEEAAELLVYLNQVGGESDNLLIGENGFGMTVEEEEQFIETKNNSATSVILVGKIDGEVVSVGSIFGHEQERVSHIGDLGISVREKYWGNGAGSAMMQALIDFARQTERLEIIHLGTRAENENAILLYRKFGFQEIGRFPQFFKVGEAYYDEILMNLYLHEKE